MALPCKTGIGRPNLPVYGSYPGYGDAGRPVSGQEMGPPITYEGYRITPRGSGYDRGKGKWYRAHTTEMPATLRDLEHMVRNRSLSGRTVLEELYSSRLEGSKREHIESFIRARDASDPGRKHDLAYLHLDQYQRRKVSKPSKLKTAAMQIILECRIRPRNHAIPSQQPVSSCGSSIIKEGWDPLNVATASIHGAAMKTSRPQYLPQYARQGEATQANTWDNQGDRNPVIPVPKTTISDYDSDDSEEARPASACSTVSSDAVMSETRRRSSSSVSNRNASIISQTTGVDSCNEDSCATVTMAEDQIGELWSLRDSSGREYHLPPSICRDLIDSVGQKSPKSVTPCIREQRSVGTQIDWEVDHSDCTRPLPRHSEPPKTLAKPGELEEAASCQSKVQSPEKTFDPERYSETKPNDCDELHSKGSRQESAEVGFFEKPKWMDNLRPGSQPNYFCPHKTSSELNIPAVCTPTIQDEDIDPLDNNPNLECGPIRKPEVSAEHSKKDAVSEVEDKATKATDKDGFSPKDHSQAPNIAEVPISASSIERNDEAPPVRNNIASAVNLTSARDPQPLTPLRLDVQSQSRKESEDLSPRQRKHVTFSLPSPASTVPSTPIVGTPPSSPDTSSSTSSEFIPPPAPSKTSSPHYDHNLSIPKGPCRPPLHRSSHSSSNYTAKMRAHEPMPLRSSSCRDLPVREPVTHRSQERDKSSRQSDRYDRYQTDSMTKARGKPAVKAPVLVQQSQLSVQKMYDCKISRCPRKGSSGFMSRDDVEGHVRAVHDKEGTVVRK